MSNSRFSRRRLLAAALPVAAVPVLGKLAAESASAEPHRHVHSHTEGHAASGHAAMIGSAVPAVGGPRDLDALLYPPPPKPYEAGRVSSYTLVATDREIEIAPDVFFPAWTYNGTVTGPVLRATEGDTLRVRLVNAGTHPHT